MTQAELALLSLQRDRRLAAAALARVLGLSRTAKSWELVGPLPEPPVLPDDETLLMMAMSYSFSARSRLILQRHATITPQSEIDARKNNAGPSDKRLSLR
jgi:hypothetical protein